MESATWESIDSSVQPWWDGVDGRMGSERASGQEGGCAAEDRPWVRKLGLNGANAVADRHTHAAVILAEPVAPELHR